MTLLKTEPAGEQLILLHGTNSPALPRIVTGAGQSATKRFLEFFTVNIRNLHTRRAYGRAVFQFLTGAKRKALPPFRRSLRCWLRRTSSSSLASATQTVK
jgi:hypothetical protein